MVSCFGLSAHQFILFIDVEPHSDGIVGFEPQTNEIACFEPHDTGEFVNGKPHEETREEGQTLIAQRGGITGRKEEPEKIKGQIGGMQFLLQ